jgi:hypothetical protein
MALLSSRGISTPSLPAQGEQRRSSIFNIPRDIPLDGDRVDMVLDPLAERVGEPREAAYRHVDGQIMALDH